MIIAGYRPHESDGWRDRQLILSDRNFICQNVAYPAVLNAGAVLRTTARDVRHLDEPGLQRYLKDVGLYAPRVAELAMDGTDLLAADLTSVNLDLSDSDAEFLRAALEWWDITSSCAENPKMYAAIGGGGRRASVEKGYY